MSNIDKKKAILPIIPIITTVIILLLVNTYIGFYESPRCSGDYAKSTIAVNGVNLPNIFTWITYAFVHCDENHFLSNTSLLIVFGYIFFYLFGIKKGVAVGFGIIFLSSAFEAISIKLTHGYLFIQGFVNFEILLNTYPSGAGISSFLTGIMVLIIIYQNKPLRDKINIKRLFDDLWDGQTRFLTFVLQIFWFLLPISLLLIVLGDFHSYVAGIWVYYHNADWVIPAFFFSLLKDFLLIFYKIVGSGNGQLAHFMGIIAALVIWKLWINKSLRNEVINQ
jgi:hypothetical protein